MIASLARRLPFFYGWVVVAVVFVTMALAVNARTAFSLLMPPILSEFEWNRGVTAGAFSFGFMVSALLSPTLGRLMDRYGPRVVNLFGVCITTLGLLLATLSTQPWHLYATLGVLVGGGSVCLGYSGQTLFLPNWFARRRGLATGVAFAGVGVGSILLFPWFQGVIEAAGWRAACWTLGLVVLVVAGPLTLLLRKRPEDLGLRADGDAAPSGAAVGATPDNVVDREWAAVDWTLARAMRTARFWWIGLGFFGGLYVWYAVQVHQTKYLLEVGFSATEAAWALGAVSLAGIPGQILLGALSDRIGREAVWAIGCLGFALTYALLLALGAGAAHNTWLMTAMVIAQGLIGYGMTPVFGAIVMEVFQGKHFGTIFGTLMLGAIGGGAVGPWVTGLLHDFTGNYVAAFWIAIALCALSTVAILRASPGKVRSVAGRTRRASP